MRAYPSVVVAILCAGCASSTDVSAGTKTYTGQYSAVMIQSTVSTSLQGGGTFPCTNTYTMSGTITLHVADAGSASSGNADIEGDQTETAHSNGASCKATGSLSTGWTPVLTVAGADIRFDDQSVSTNGGFTETNTVSFAGTLANGVITGTLGFSGSGSGILDLVTSVNQSYAVTMSVTLHQ